MSIEYQVSSIEYRVSSIDGTAQLWASIKMLTAVIVKGRKMVMTAANGVTVTDKMDYDDGNATMNICPPLSGSGTVNTWMYKMCVGGPSK